MAIFYGYTFVYYWDVLVICANVVRGYWVRINLKGSGCCLTKDHGGHIFFVNFAFMILVLVDRPYVRFSTRSFFLRTLGAATDGLETK